MALRGAPISPVDFIGLLYLVGSSLFSRRVGWPPRPLLNSEYMRGGACCVGT